MNKPDAPLISVVVPIYKVEQYLRRCIDSILNQTYSKLEIILVDDGSPDNCGMICDEYAKTDSRIRVCHKENGGLSDARNCGVGHATGEYVTFIDADDYVSSRYVEYLYQLLKSTEADVACCDYMRTDGNDCAFSQSEERVILTSQDACMQMIERKVALIVSWGKLFPLALVKRNPFPKGKIHEDEFTTYRFYYESERIVFGCAKLYAYFQNEHGIIKSGKEKKQVDAYEAFIQRSEFFESQGEKALAAASWRRYRRKLISDNQKHQNWSLEEYKQLLKSNLFHSRFTLREKACDVCYIYFPWLWHLGKGVKALRIISCVLPIIFTRRAIIFCAPFHDNLGDSAIAVAEEVLLKKAGFPGWVEIDTRTFLRWQHLFQRIIPASRPLFLHGGGNMGDLWEIEEQARRELVARFPQNQMIAFPQTLFYSDPEKEKASAKYYADNKKLTLFAREQISYRRMLELYPGTRVLLAPDMVLFTELKDYGAALQPRTDVLICARSDAEKKVDAEQWERIELELAKAGAPIRKTDMYRGETVTSKNRKTCVREKLEEFCRAKLVVTDRLHGMLFSVLAGTPCVVLSNYNHKISGTYSWISNLPHVCYAETTEQALEAIRGFLPEPEKMARPWQPLTADFDELRAIVKDNGIH